MYNFINGLIMIKIMYKHIDKLHFIIQIKVKRKMRNSLFFTYTTFLLIYISTEFQFKAPSVSGTPLTINTTASYQITAQRQYTQQVSDTPYDTQLVPSGSNLTIVFPDEYSLSGSETCSFVAYSFNFISGFAFTVDIPNNQIIITNSVTADTAISDILIGLQGIVNPTPAVTTSPFILHIGNDYSANDQFSAVTLSPGALTGITITFNPATVNTTGDMMISLQPTNVIPIGSNIIVEFPFSLAWAKDVNQANQLPIDGTQSCTGYSSNINIGGITCSGLTSTREVTITNIINQEINTNQTIQFSINNLFSPPTTQEGADHLTVTTQTGGHTIDTTTTASITSLQPQELTDLIINPTSASMTVNAFTGLLFKFTLTDTITNDDIFYIDFPVGTNINYLTSISSFSLTNISYDSGTGRMQFYQNANSQTLTVGQVANITFLTYQAPPSTEPVTGIAFWVMHNGYSKMKGTGSIQAVTKEYQMEVTTDSTTINVGTSYHLQFNLADSLSSSAFIEITVPPQVILSSIDVLISGTQVHSNPLISVSNTSMLTLSQFNTSTSDISPQTITLTLETLTQPSSVKTISSFGMTIYYSSSGYEVATGTQNTTIVTTPGNIDVLTISSSSMVTYQECTLTIAFANSNQIQNSGYIQVYIPSQIQVPSSLSVCEIVGKTIGSCSVSGNVVRLGLGQVIGQSSSLQIRIGLVRNPTYTKQSSQFVIKTYNSGNELIDNTHATTSGNTLTVTTPSVISSIALTRSSTINYGTGDYVISFTHNQILQHNNTIITITIPNQVSITPSSACVITYAQSQQCAINNNTVTIYLLQTQQSTSFTYSLTITNVQNAISLQPATSYIQVQTNTNDGFTYSTGSASSYIINTVLGSFVSFTYAFSNRQINDVSDVSVAVNMHNSLNGYIIIQLADDLSANGASFSCQSSQFTPICSVIVNGTSTNIKIQSSDIPTTFSILLQNIINPTFVSTFYSFSTVISYTNTHYAIDQQTSTIQFSSLCTFPCRQCNSSTPTLCTSCYQQSDNLTTKVYLHSGQCVSDCGNGYFENNGVCQECQSPCVQCQGSADSCTYCDSNSTNKFLHNASCQVLCPSGYYDDKTQIPHICLACVSPCLTCVSSGECQSCEGSYFFVPHTLQCVLSCPASSPIANNISYECENCSSICLTCAGTGDSCTSCDGSSILHNDTCLSECPGKMIVVSSQCVACDPQCDTCEGQVDNCTSCSSSFPYLYLTTCLLQCPDFYYVSGNACESCVDLNIGCQDCSDVDNCSSCDSGLILLDNKCLNYTPSGYINISGQAVPCEGDCLTCESTVTNCTSCTNLSLSGNTCTSNCPIGTISIAQVCTQCQYPCLTCENSITSCSSCFLNSSLYLSDLTKQCVSESSCPAQTYANATTLSCETCIGPCLQCSSVVSCESCISSYYFYANASDCVSTCPFGWVGIVNECEQCQSPCQDCQNSTTKCTDCISGYFMNSLTNQCLVACPSGTLSNMITMQCEVCDSPCSTCQNTTDTCLSCSSSTFLFGTECLSVCDQGYYGSAGQCRLCQNGCLTCSSSVNCVSCSYPSVLYNSQCLSACPSQTILNSENECVSCSSIIQNCSTCNSNGQCTACFSPSIYLNGACYATCPDGYVLSQGSCVTVQQNAQQELQRILTSTSSFPMPFTIVGLVIFVACFMSKLQNKNTYLIGTAYSLFGILQTASLGFMIWKYYDSGNYEQNYIQLFLITLGIIYGINLLGLLIQSPLLCYDQKFSKWVQVRCNKAFFIIVSILSFLINYKLKMIIFTKLFSFFCVRGQLQNIQKFRIFNILSFLGIGHEGLLLYAGVIIAITLDTTTQIFFTFLDAICIAFLGILLSIAASHKDPQFFVEEDNGYLLNHKVMVEGDDNSKQGLKPSLLHGEENKNQMQSHDIIKEDDEYYEDEELSLSISADNRSGIDFDPDESVKSKRSKNNIFIQDEQTSNAIKRETMISQGELQNNEQKEKVRKSVLLDESDNMYDEEDLVHNNKTVLLPPRQTQKGQKSEKTRKSPIRQLKQSQEEKEHEGEGEELEQGKIRKEKETKIYSKQRIPTGEDEDIQTKIKKKEQQLKGLKKEVNNKETRLSRKRSRNSFDSAEEQKPNTKPVGTIKKNISQSPSKHQNGQGPEDFIFGQENKNGNENGNFSSNENRSDSKTPVKSGTKTPVKTPISSPSQGIKSGDKDKVKIEQFPEKQFYFQDSKIEQTSLVKKTNKENEQEMYSKHLNAQMPQQNINQQISTNSKIIESQAFTQKGKNDNRSKVSEHIEDNNQSFKNKEASTFKNIDKNQSVKTVIEAEKKKPQKFKNIEKQEDISVIESSMGSQGNLIQKGSFISESISSKQQTQKNKRKPVRNIFDEYLSDEQEDQTEKEKEGFGEKISERPGEEESPEKKETNSQRRSYEFEQVQDEFEDYQHQKKKYLTNEAENSSGLDESRPDYDEEINHRPLESSFAKSEKKKDTIINLLQNSNKGKRIKVQGASNSKKIPSEEEQQHREKLNRQTQTQRRKKPPLQRPSSTDKSRMYLAGLRQLQDQTLTKKNSIGYPVNNRKSSTGFIDDSEEVSDLESKRQDNKKRNKSLYNVPFKKQTSKQISSGDIDDMSFKNAGFGNFNPYTDQTLNERYTPHHSTTMQIDTNNDAPNKPVVSGTSRNNRMDMVGLNKREGYYTRGSFTREDSKGRKQSPNVIKNRKSQMNEDDDELQRYYNKESRKSREKYEFQEQALQMQRSKSKSRSKSKDKNKESSKRIKQLEKVYLQRLTGPGNKK